MWRILWLRFRARKIISGDVADLMALMWRVWDLKVQKKNLITFSLISASFVVSVRSDETSLTKLLRSWKHSDTVININPLIKAHAAMFSAPGAALELPCCGYVHTKGEAASSMLNPAHLWLILLKVEQLFLLLFLRAAGLCCSLITACCLSGRMSIKFIQTTAVTQKNDSFAATSEQHYMSSV